MTVIFGLPYAPDGDISNTVLSRAIPSHSNSLGVTLGRASGDMTVRDLDLDLDLDLDYSFSWRQMRRNKRDVTLATT
jgi:hypothetical protein